MSLDQIIRLGTRSVWPAETACQSVVFATLLTAAQCWRGLRMTRTPCGMLDSIRQERYPL